MSSGSDANAILSVQPMPPHLQNAPEDKAPVTKTLAPEVMKRLDRLHELQKQYAEERAKCIAERKALEAKYATVYAELYKQRTDVITGAVDPAEASDKSKGIEGFWLQALQNQRRVSSYIFDHDEEALKFLTNITLEYVDDFQGFKLLFHFAPNPFFDNEVLTKTFNIPDMMGGASGGEPSVESLPGTEIKWKAGKNLTVKVIKKTVKKKGKKTTVSKEEPQDSFFAFFDSPDMESEPENMEEAFEIQEQVQGDLAIGFSIRDKVIPRAVDWFTGEAVNDDSDDDDDEDDDYDEDDDDDEEDDDEDDAPPRKAIKGGKGGKKAAKEESEDEDEDEEDEDVEATRAALSNAFKKSVKGKDAPKDDKDKDGKGGAPAPASGDKPPECKQQ